MKTKFRSKIYKICMWCDNLPMPQRHTSRSLATVNHHKIILWNKILNVSPRLKSIQSIFKTNHASIGWRAPLRANRLRRARAKKCQTKFTMENFLISKNTQRVYNRLRFIWKEKSHSTFKSTRGIICHFTSQSETKSPIKWIHQRIGPQTTALSF